MNISPAVDVVLSRTLQAIEPVPGIAAVVLGGSRSRGVANTQSDTDIGLLYFDSEPIDTGHLRAVARGLDGRADAVVTDLGGWGRWVNGGAWLTIDGERVDLLYRSIDRLRAVIAECKAGAFEHDYGQQPPFGFYSHIYLAELHYCVALRDPDGVVADLKAEVATYPSALKRQVVQHGLWNAAFSVSSLKNPDDRYIVSGAIVRATYYLTQVLFGLNERYFISDKTALAEIATFAVKPNSYTARVKDALEASPRDALAIAQSLVADLITIAGDLYKRPFP